MTNVTLMNVDNGYILSYPKDGSQKHYIFKSLQETFDFIARLYNDIDYYNEKLVEAINNIPHYENTDTGNSITT